MCWMLDEIEYKCVSGQKTKCMHEMHSLIYPFFDHGMRRLLCNLIISEFLHVRFFLFVIVSQAPLANITHFRAMENVSYSLTFAYVNWKYRAVLKVSLAYRFPFFQQTLSWWHCIVLVHCTPYINLYYVENAMHNEYNKHICIYKLDDMYLVSTAAAI